MASDNELLIKINADSKNAQKAFDDIKSKTEDLEDQLSKIAKVSAVAFAAFTVEIFASAHAFDEAELASRELTNALKNQGIYTEELANTYKDYAAELQKATGLDDDATVSALALGQSYLGQTVITKELTQAIADYAAFKKTDLASAAEVLTKSIGTETNVLARQGLQFSATATEAEKYQKVLDFVALKAGGLAVANNQGLGSLKGLQSAFGDFQESIGATFQPIISAVIGALTRMFQFFNDYPIISKFATALIVAGTALSAVGVAVPLIVAGITTLTAAMAAFGVTTNIALGGLPVIIAAIASGVIILTGVLYANGNAMKNQSKTAEESAGKVAALEAEYKKLEDRQKSMASTAGSQREFGGGAQVNQSKLDAIRAQIVAEKKLEADLRAKEDKEAPILESKKKAADREAADKRAHGQILKDIETNNIELIRLQNENGSAELISIKQKEIAILKELSGQNSADKIAQLRAAYDEQVALELEQRAQDEERKLAYLELDAAARQELIANQQNESIQLSDAQRAELEKRVLTEKQIEQKALIESEQAKIDARNRELEMRKKYGVTVAAIDAILHSTQVTATKELTGELVGMAQSKNATLKAIGQAAAVAQITIGTAESAVNVYTAASRVLPFPVSVVVGGALAAARIAFGAEQIGNVLGAADGGLITGGIPGVDSVPVLAQQGELVAPARNFDEVVGSVSASRNSRDDEIVDLLSQLVNKQGGGSTVVVQGDVLAEDSYIDAFAKKLSDALEFRNVRIFGVNT